MVMTCFYIRIDRENAIALRESRKNGEEDDVLGKKGKKVAEDDGQNDEKENAAAIIEESNDDDDSGDGKFFKKFRRGGVYVLRCRCFVGATTKNMITIIFGVLMIINAFLKVASMTSINNFMSEAELSADYVDF